MLEANAGSATPLAGAPLWLPGKKMESGFMAAPVSSRSLEIAKSREELLLLLHDVPESEYELSLTDLVEHRSLAAGNFPLPPAGKDKKDSPPGKEEEEKKKKKKKRRTSSGGGSDGVMLNLYVPSSLSRSLTTPMNGRRRPAVVAEDDGKKRDAKAARSVGCWSGLWQRGKKRASHG